MGKSAVYVVLAILVLGLLAAVTMWLVAVVRHVTESRRNRWEARLRAETPWTAFQDVDSSGYTIGIHRRMPYGVTPTEEPITMCTLPLSHDALDVELKYSDAKDRAAAVNAAQGLGQNRKDNQR
jgi:hypothetical protein